MTLDGSVKIIDCFTFFNEVELLELRLKTLENVVDHFVIVEARETFQGKKKPLVFQDNAAKFSRYSHKIIHLVLDRFQNTASSWSREAEQRDYMNSVIAEFDDDDIVILSDVDELLRPECIQELRQSPPDSDEVVCFSLNYYFYYLNLLYAEPWQRQGPRAVLKRTFPGMQKLRSVRGPINRWPRNLVRGLRASVSMRRAIVRRLVLDAGWHFAWLGGEERALEKVMAISTHSKMDKPGIALQTATLNARRQAIANRDTFNIVPIDDSFPADIRSNIVTWQAFILTEDVLSQELRATAD